MKLVYTDERCNEKGRQRQQCSRRKLTDVRELDA